jgi:hypothetical protein
VETYGGGKEKGTTSLKLERCPGGHPPLSGWRTKDAVCSLGLRVFFAPDNWQQGVAFNYAYVGRRETQETPRGERAPGGELGPLYQSWQQPSGRRSKRPPQPVSRTCALASHGRRTYWKSGMEAIHQMHLVSSLGPRSRVWGSGGYPARGGEPIMDRHPVGPRETVASGARRLHEENAISASGPSARRRCHTGQAQTTQLSGRAGAGPRQTTAAHPPCGGRRERGEARPQCWDAEATGEQPTAHAALPVTRVSGLRPPRNSKGRVTS